MKRIFLTLVAGTTLLYLGSLVAQARVSESEDYRLEVSGPAEAHEGFEANYVITLKNTASEQLSGKVQVIINAPDVHDIVPAPSEKKTYSSTGQTWLTFDGDLNGGETRKITLAVKVPSTNFPLAQNVYVPPAGLSKVPILEVHAQQADEAAITQADTRILAKNAPAGSTPKVKYTDDTPASSTILPAVFKEIFGKNPSKTELTYWNTRLDDQRTVGAMRTTMKFFKSQHKTIGTKVTKAQIGDIFKSVYGRVPLGSEKKYWEKVLADKPSREELLSAMAFQKTHHSAGVGVVAAPKPAVKITTKNFAITGPDGLEMNGNDQAVSWSASDAVRKAYPSVKLELCSGKPFRGCMVLLGSTPNDGGQSVNLAPVSRAGRWYLHMIGRDIKNTLQGKVSAERIVVLHK
jgi:hypothetical protein